MIPHALPSSLAWTENRATQRCDPSAAPGARTEVRAARYRPAPLLRLPLRDWRPRDKPSRHEAAIPSTGCPSTPPNAPRSKFQLRVNQDTCTTPMMMSFSVSTAVRRVQPVFLRPALARRSFPPSAV
jgi:hypothetical protein